MGVGAGRAAVAEVTAALTVTADDGPMLGYTLGITVDPAAPCAAVVRGEPVTS